MIFVLMGPPGAGKGTQCEMITARDEYSKLATGDLLRKNIKDGTKLGLYAKDIMAKGLLLPDDVLLDLVKDGLSNRGTEHFVLDGYPRTVKQGQDLIELVGSELKAVVHIDVPEEELISRISGRRVCSDCGTNYHLTHLPPTKDGICDKCDSKLLTRPDDSIEKIKVRLAVYHEQTEPLETFFSEKGLYHKVNGIGESDEVLKEILSLLQA